MPSRVLVTGVGAFVPARRVDDARIARAMPGWSAERIAEKTAIHERRYLWELDEERGVAVAPAESAEPASNSDMCELALRRALASARVEADALDLVVDDGRGGTP